MSIGEAAELLHVNRVTIWRWLNQGILEGEQVGKTTVIRVKELEKVRR